MALPAADLMGAAQPVAIVLVEELGEELAGILLERHILIADADVDAARRLGEQPAVKGLYHAIENHLDVVRLESDAFPPAHDRLDQPAPAAIDAELRMGAVGHDRMLRMHLAAVNAAEAGDTVIAGEQIARLEIADEPYPERERALQQQVVEGAAAADQCRRVGITGQHELAISRGDQPQPFDPIGCSGYGLAGAELLQHGNTLGRYGAAAGLV